MLMQWGRWGRRYPIVAAMGFNNYYYELVVFFSARIFHSRQLSLGHIVQYWTDVIRKTLDCGLPPLNILKYVAN